MEIIHTIWLIYHKKIKFTGEGVDKIGFISGEAKRAGLPFEIKFVQDFEIRGDRLYYENILVEKLPKIVSAHSESPELERYFEKNGVNVVNSAKTNILCKDKLKCQKIIAKLAIEMPRSIPIENRTFEQLSKILGLPFVLKDNFGKKGENVYLINDKTSFLEKAGGGIVYLAQEYIAPSKGEDVRVFVIGNKITGVMKRKNTHDWRSNLNQGGWAEKFSLNKKEKDMALRIARELNLEIGAVDFLFGSNGLLFCEANSCPGVQGFFDIKINMIRKCFIYLKKKLNAI